MPVKLVVWVPAFSTTPVTVMYPYESTEELDETKFSCRGVAETKNVLTSRV